MPSTDQMPRPVEKIVDSSMGCYKSLLDIRADLPDEEATAITAGLRLLSLPAALIACAPASYRQKPTDMRTALALTPDASES